MDQLIGLPDALAEHRRYFEQDFWGLLNDAEERLTGNRQDFTGFWRRHGCRPGPTVQEGHVTEEIRRVQDAQNHLIAMLIFNGDLYHSTLQNVKCTARIINMHDRGVLFVVLFAHDTGKLMKLVFIKLREQWDLCEKIDVRQHNFTSHP